MTVAITASPTSPRAKKDATKITVSGQPSNSAAGYDPEIYPTEPEIVCYLKAQAPAGSTPALDLVTAPFSTNPESEAHQCLPIQFPVAGVWTLKLLKASDDSTLATQAITVQA